MGLKKKRETPIRISPLLYSRRDLNPHGHNGHWILSPTCLPIPPLEPLRRFKSATKVTKTIYIVSSEKRDSNPRPPPWQGDALPTELFSPILPIGRVGKFKTIL